MAIGLELLGEVLRPEEVFDVVGSVLLGQGSERVQWDLYLYLLYFLHVSLLFDECCILGSLLVQNVVEKTVHVALLELETLKLVGELATHRELLSLKETLKEHINSEVNITVGHIVPQVQLGVCL